jgi:AhpD family alkylhydroperoxidase
MQLDDRILRLIAVGASVAANCQPCLESSVRQALEQGADEHQVAQAIAIGRMIRNGASSGVDRFISSLSGTTSSIPGASGEICECGS